MLKTIQYDYTFSNGATRKFSADLQAGSTMVTGKNGRGKSLILETFSFLLFGAQALRGKADDYKKISASCRVAIRGKDYIINRTKSKAEVLLVGEDTPLASSTTAVNNFVTNLLGYDYNVYRLSNWCAQGEIQALAQMAPKDRKEMIDQVAGLNQVDALIDFIKQETRLIKANIAGIESAAIQPSEPNKPVRPREDMTLVRTQHNDLMVQLKEYESQEKLLSQVKAPVQPSEPVKQPLPEQPEPLAAVVRPEPKSQPIFTAIEPTAPELLRGNNRADVDARLDTVWSQIEGFVQRLKTTSSKLETLKRTVGEAALSQLDHVVQHTVEYWTDQLFYWGQKTTYENLRAQGDVSCPSCGHRHPVASDALQQYDTSKFPEVQPLDINTIKCLFVIQQEQLELAQIERELDAVFSNREHMLAMQARIPQLKAELANYDKAMAEYCRARETFDREFAHVKQMNDNIEANYQARCEEQAQREAERFNNWKERCRLITLANEEQERQYAQALNAYNIERVLYQTSQESLQRLAESFDFQANLNKAVSLQSELNRLEVDWRVYDQMFEQYEKQMASYTLVLERLQSERRQLEDRERAHKALNDLKARVKTYLIPSLNKVASYLLSEMTGGEFNSVNIDDEFEVYVDGQALRTMSGSAKDVTNLALRIGLGRILTHKVLGMMMLDEIDQGMDADRAAYTWQCIERVTPQIGQVLVVSHKDLHAENRLEVA